MTSLSELWSALRLESPDLASGVPGDPGLFGPGSTVWRIGRERVLLVGGQAALLLQVAHPLVAAGVAAHSEFRLDPYRRLRATLDATLTISFGDTAQARRAAAGVRAVHRAVRGTLPVPVGRYPAGMPFDAEDPALALWVHATLVIAALAAYDRFVRRLASQERAEYYEESKRFARLFGVTDRLLPRTNDHFLAYVQDMVEGPDLVVGPQARAIAHDVLHPPVPRAIRPAAALARSLTAGLLPPRLRDAYGLGQGSLAWMSSRAAALALYGMVRTLPPAARYWPHARSAERRLRSV
jgi:uncharacterized protein (DUF2236 family)